MASWVQQRARTSNPARTCRLWSLSCRTHRYNNSQYSGFKKQSKPDEWTDFLDQGYWFLSLKIFYAMPKKISFDRIFLPIWCVTEGHNFCCLTDKSGFFFFFLRMCDSGVTVHVFIFHIECTRGTQLFSSWTMQNFYVQNSERSTTWINRERTPSYHYTIWEH